MFDVLVATFQALIPTFDQMFDALMQMQTFWPNV